MPPNASCRDCLYWTFSRSIDCEREEDVQAVCRRYPPTRIVNDVELEEYWPVTMYDDWCGEWKTSRK
jgi:hypothetical protein